MVAPEAVLLRVTHNTWPLPATRAPHRTLPRYRLDWPLHLQSYLSPYTRYLHQMATTNAHAYVDMVLSQLLQRTRLPTREEQLIALFESLPPVLTPKFLFNMPTDVTNFERKLTYDLYDVYPPIRLLPLNPTVIYATNTIPNQKYRKRTCPRAPRLCYNCKQPGHEVSSCWLLQYWLWNTGNLKFRIYCFSNHWTQDGNWYQDYGMTWWTWPEEA